MIEANNILLSPRKVILLLRFKNKDRASIQIFFIKPNGLIFNALVASIQRLSSRRLKRLGKNFYKMTNSLTLEED